MRRRPTWFPKRLREDAGQTLVEYVIIVCLMAIGLLSVLALMYRPVTSVFDSTAALLRTLVLEQ